MLPPRERSFQNDIPVPAPKRQKTNTDKDKDKDVAMVDVVPVPMTITTTPNGNEIIKKSSNLNLKGRKRFNKDLEDTLLAISGSNASPGSATAATKTIFGLKVLLSKGDDGAFSISLTRVVGAGTDAADGDHLIICITYLISEVSDYPSSHTFFTYCESESSSESESSLNLKALQDGISERDGHTVQDEIVRFSYGVAKIVGIQGLPLSAWDVGVGGKEESDEELEDDGSEYNPFEEDYMGGEDDDGDDIMITSLLGKHSAPNMSSLKSHFHQIVEHSFRPGLVKFGGDDFIISVSIPLTLLTSPSTSPTSSKDFNIPAQALIAWDRRLLTYPYHLTLLICGWRGVYPYDIHNHGGGKEGITFKVGLTKGGYKPSREHAREASRTFGLVVEKGDFEKPDVKAQTDWMDDDDDEPPPTTAMEEEEEEDEEGKFERFALSNSLDTLLDQKFIRMVQLRLAHGLNWGGAEKMYEIMEANQVDDTQADAGWKKIIVEADQKERLRASSSMPPDPLLATIKNKKGSTDENQDTLNLPLVAFCYILRRLMFCTEYCVVCHCPLELGFEVLKPYVCGKDLCRYQYYVMGAGPSLEYEIVHNPSTVDLLVSLAYVSASEHVMQEPLPTGMALHVRWDMVQSALLKYESKSTSGYHSGYRAAPAEIEDTTTPPVDEDGKVDFDKLGKSQIRAVIVALINKLPPILDMKKHLQRKVKPGKMKPKLKDMLDGGVPEESWLILRWCVASCTSYLEEIPDSSDHIGGLDPSWRQFRFSVGAPDAEAKFKHEYVKAGQETKYPSTYAFHGSPLRNWHSIIRHGLWARTIANGRAYGDGVYLAKEGLTSMQGYAGGSTKAWANSTVGPLSCTALAEIINLPTKYVSNTPHIVIKDTHWIMCRYLLVKGTIVIEEPESTTIAANTSSSADGLVPGTSIAGGMPSFGGSPSSTSAAFLSKRFTSKNQTKQLASPLEQYQQHQVQQMFKFDPLQNISIHGKQLEIPIHSYKVDQLVMMMEAQFVWPDVDEEDRLVFEWSGDSGNGNGNGKGKGKEVIEISSDDEDSMVVDHPTRSKTSISSSSNTTTTTSGGNSRTAKQSKIKPIDDWKHDPDWVRTCTQFSFPPPVSATSVATSAIQRELRSMLKEQENASSFAELGWCMPEEFIGDNLFQWIVEMHSFDPDIPIAKDMKQSKVNSIVFEIRFPPSFPMSPPFFMIKGPRFLPFIQGGGGHVTGGGSICMDLLTSDGWLPSYSISAVLMQIKLAISNLDPKPARLATNWKMVYSPREALEGFKRAAATHGWQVPQGLDVLIR